MLSIICTADETTLSARTDSCSVTAMIHTAGATVSTSTAVIQYALYSVQTLHIRSCNLNLSKRKNLMQQYILP